MRPTAPWRDDLITSLLSVTLVVGLFLDGWNHINLQNGALGSFFTIWHALVYAGFTATWAWIMSRNPHLFNQSLQPAPYMHRLFGIPMRYPIATFFDFNDGNVKPNKQMDPKISSPLFTLPLGAIASHKAPIALMQRNLLRHVTWSMPSGQSIARAMNAEVLSPADLEELSQYDLQLERNTPLFYYMLKEAQLVPDSDIGKNTGGLHLGPVGGRAVAEVVVGLLESDPASYVVQQPGWTPTLQRPGPSFRMTDFLTFAGVDPATRHAQKPDFA